jgi:3-hydroxyacyl-CoA dehydrogenase
MEYIERLQNVSVLGAAGKMGSGILLLAALEITNQSLQNPSKTFKLNAIDVSEEALQGLLKYVEKQARKKVEKKPALYQAFFPDRPEEELPQLYVDALKSILFTSLDLSPAYESNLVFEAVIENQDLKKKLLGDIDKNNPNKPWFFTNTSSIPIKLLNDALQLNGRILGFHFYNPPAIQKLVELISNEQNSKEMIAFANEYAKNLRKIIVPSNDFAGFIGNGHFMRDALHGILTAQHLSDKMPLTEAIFAVNKVSQDFLIRPMGIFQLIDYVGVDVVKFIMAVMNPYLPDENLHSDLLDQMMEAGVKGGQNSDGSQKNGFLQYDKGRVTGVYDLAAAKYVAADEIKGKVADFLGSKPASWKPWKEVNFSGEKENLLNAYFAELKTMNNNGAIIAKEYIRKSCDIGELLVNTGVANSKEDVNTVMLTGFFHAYGPINEYL